MLVFGDQSVSVHVRKIQRQLLQVGRDYCKLEIRLTTEVFKLLINTLFTVA